MVVESDGTSREGSNRNTRTNRNMRKPSATRSGSTGSDETHAQQPAVQMRTIAHQRKPRGESTWEKTRLETTGTGVDTGPDTVHRKEQEPDTVNMRITEQAVLLEVVHGTKKTKKKNRNGIIAAAILMDLNIEGRIDTDSRMLNVVDHTPTQDAILDPSLKAIIERAEGGSPEQWIEWTKDLTENARSRALQRLQARGCVTIKNTGLKVGGRTWFKGRKVTKINNGEIEKITALIMEAAFEEAIPETQALGIACLAGSGGWIHDIANANLAKECAEKVEKRRSIDRIGLALKWVLEKT